MKIYLDFESRSQVDIWQTGAWEYSKHPSTEILCIAIGIDDDPVLVYNRMTIPSIVVNLNALIKNPNVEFHAFNAFFEQSMWINKFSPVYGLLPIPIKQWRCTQAKALAHGLPKSLEKAAEALKLLNKKDMAGSKVMKQIASSKGPIAQNQLDILYQYCKKDVIVEREMDQVLPDLDAKEQKIWFLDQYINQTGIRVDMTAVGKINSFIEIETDRLTNELNSISNGEITSGTQRDSIKNWLVARGLELPDMTKQTVTTALASASGDIKRVLFLRQQLSMTSNAKYKTLMTSVGEDNRLRDTQMYHGTQTGRWSGKTFQLQNLPKPKLQNFDSVKFLDLVNRLDYSELVLLYEDDLLNAFSSAIRSVLVPDPGYDMFTTDFSAIEARVIMWLADETAGLEIFRQQDKDPTVPDIYVYMARTIYNKATLSKKDKAQRQLGKQAVLGCGFGMGHVKFKDTCASYGIDIDLDLAVRTVKSYRATFKNVVNFWYQIEHAAKQTILTKTPHQVGKILFYLDGVWLRMKLPRGRDICYHHPRVIENKIQFLGLNNVTNKYEIEATWGGTLCENATQAVARDLMAEAMLNLTSVGFQILFTVHDEIVIQAKKDTKTCQDVLKIVTTVPSWATGCPINAECEKVERYKK